MHSILKLIYLYFIWFGINLPVFWKSLMRIPSYVSDYINLKKQRGGNFKIIPNYPCLTDKDDNWWVAQWHYFHQDLLVAQKIYKANPQKHVDIWSRIDWFVSHVATFRKIEVFDIRPIENHVDNIKFKQADLMNLDESLINYTSSISSLHVIEHFWLWRYWDIIDINWHLKWLENVYKILKRWGIFYFAVPIGDQRIEFNAHRIFSIKYLNDIFNDRYDLVDFSYVDDNWNLHVHVDIKTWIKNNFNCKYGCWIFELRKV